MAINSQFESLVEQAAIKWFKDLGYEYLHGSQISSDDRQDTTEVVLNKVLMDSLKKINPEIKESCIEEAYRTLKTFNYPTIENNNKDIHKLIREGVKVTYNDENGEEIGEIVNVFDYDNILNNSFIVCNQVTIKGDHTPRIPDILVYINGLPIAVFEIKNPLDENATIEGAYRQINLYKRDIPDLFYYNEICVISDSTESKAGTLSANFERYSAWKSIENGKIDKEKTSLFVVTVTITERFYKKQIALEIRNSTLDDELGCSLLEEGIIKNCEECILKCICDDVYKIVDKTMNVVSSFKFDKGKINIDKGKSKV